MAQGTMFQNQPAQQFMDCIFLKGLSD